MSYANRRETMVAIARIEPGLGTGIYTYSCAAKLLKVSTAQVRGWAEGYVRHVRGESCRGEPVLQTCPSQGLLTFYDLVELMFVREYRKCGIKLDHIRKTAKELAEAEHTVYPFAQEKLVTDGTQLMVHMADGYLNVADKQRVVCFVDQILKDIEFDKEDLLARRWHPLGRKSPAVVDPKRGFGLPIDEESGVRLHVLYATYTAERDIDAVADWYGVDKRAVEAAIEFEEHWLKEAA